MLAASPAIDPQLAAPLWVCLGAVPGALSRYYLTRFCLQRFGSDFPSGTFLINLTGCGGMGFLTTLIGRGSPSRLCPTPLTDFCSTIAFVDLRLLVAVGFLGAYTTFSTYVLDTSTLWRSGRQGRALLYGIGSAVFGLVALAIGRLLAGHLP